MKITGMVDVFKTNVCDIRNAERLAMLLCRRFPLCKVSFDLEDCDKILRIEDTHIIPQAVIAIIAAQGFICEPLED